MESFGVQFAVQDLTRLKALTRLFEEVKRDKDAGALRDPNAWLDLIPDEVKLAFDWPTKEDREYWLNVRNTTPIWVPEPSEQIGERWDFYRIWEAIEDGDYDILGCVTVADRIAEVQIDPHGYPYGGVGPVIALVEAFGFVVLGVNECGRFESRDELLYHP